jgi:hypothetical protein
MQATRLVKAWGCVQARGPRRKLHLIQIEFGPKLHKFNLSSLSFKRAIPLKA